MLARILEPSLGSCTTYLGPSALSLRVTQSARRQSLSANQVLALRAASGAT